MNKDKLREQVKAYITDLAQDPVKAEQNLSEHLSEADYYQSFTVHRIKNMSEDEVYSYISRLWTMRMWGNKHYVVDKIIEDNGLDNFKNSLIELVWGNKDIAIRWNSFRDKIKHMGSAMVSEILCKTFPDKYMLWNRRAYIALNFLEVKNLPKYDYQHTGKVYEYLCSVCKEIGRELVNAGIKNGSQLSVDYFIWDKLQVSGNLESVFKNSKNEKGSDLTSKPKQEAEFIHNDVRDRLKEIGEMLGFKASTERKVASGSVVDTVWESSIGNMGRIIYVFEVQTKGSIDSLMVNLMKALNNHAVQGIVAVSDNKQLESIRKHASGLQGLKDKLKYWDYEEVLTVYENLAFVHESINKLQLVPSDFDFNFSAKNY